MKITAVIVIALLLVGLAGAAIAQTNGQTITVTGTPVTVRVSAGTQTTLMRLWNRDISGRPIGHAYLVCHFLGSGNALGGGVSFCDASFHFPLGKIVASGVRHEVRHYTLILTGGSARYLGAAGVVNRREGQPGEALFTFELG